MHFNAIHPAMRTSSTTACPSAAAAMRTPTASSAAAGPAAGPATAPPSRTPSAPRAVRELRRLLLAASDPVHPQHEARPLACTDGPHPRADAALELALLRTWRLLSDPQSGPLLGRSFGRRGWRRLGLLLFSSSQRLVSAAAAVLQAALCPGPDAPARGPLAHIRIIRSETEARPSSADGLPPEQLRAAWAAVLDSACDKLRDCLAAQLEHEQADGHRLGAESVESPSVAVAARLVRLLGAAVAFYAVQHAPPDCLADSLDGSRALDLLLELASLEPIQPALLHMHLAALHELSALQSAVEETQDPLLPDPLLQRLLCQLTQAARSVSATNTRAVDSARIRCWRLYLELLSNATPSRRVLPPVDAVLTISDALLLAVDTSLQHAALQWLVVQLDVDKIESPCRLEHAEALARAFRLSGTLRSLSWLLLHSERPVREGAAIVLALVERYSPPADLARTLIEQGCVAIFRVVVEQLADGRDPGAEEAARLISWTRQELGDRRPFLVHACCHSVRHSTNTALRVNVVLALHILRSKEGDATAADGIRTALQAENFLDDVLLQAINDVEHDEGDTGGFSKALLDLLVNTCDPLSLLKLEHGASRRSSSNVLGGSDTPSEAKQSVDDITICCASGATVTANFAVLMANSSRVRWMADAAKRQHAPGSSTVVVEVAANAVKLAVALLSPSSTSALANHDDAALLDALEAAKVLELPVAWHSAAKALTDRLSAGNWVTLALGALRIRHPALAVRAVRHGVSSSSSEQDVARVASAMSREFFRDW